MPHALALNLHLLRDGPALVPVFEAYEVPAAEWSQGARDAMADKIAAELVAMGAEPAVAKIGAGMFISFGFAPGYGLRDMDDRILASAAEMALDAWAQGKVDAWNAAAGRRAA